MKFDLFFHTISNCICGSPKNSQNDLIHISHATIRCLLDQQFVKTWCESQHSTVNDAIDQCQEAKKQGAWKCVPS